MAATGKLELEKGNTCLHLVVSSEPGVVRACLQHIVAGDALVFLDAGVMLLGDPDGMVGMKEGRAGGFCREDLQARGLADLAKHLDISVLDTASIVRLLLDHTHCLTWK